MRGHAIPSRCPRCGETAVPAIGQRLIECRKCRLGYEWLRHTDAETVSADEPPGSPVTLDRPAGLEATHEGKTLQLLLPKTRATGAAMLAIAVASAAAGIAMILASNLPFAAFLIALAVVFGAAGLLYAFSRRRLTVTASELRVERVPFGGTSAVIAVSQLDQLAIAQTRRGRRQQYYDFELWAQTTDGDLMLLTTRDENLARYLEHRLELHLRITDDGVEMVVPGAG